MRPITRRQALGLGALGLFSAAAGGTGLVLSKDSGLAARTGGGLAEPTTLNRPGSDGRSV